MHRLLPEIIFEVLSLSEGARIYFVYIVQQAVAQVAAFIDLHDREREPAYLIGLAEVGPIEELSGVGALVSWAS